MRLLIISDIGGADARHVGDEAMLEANLGAFRSLVPSVSCTIVARDPAWVAARYGVAAVAQFGFPHQPSAGPKRDAKLEGLLRVAANGGRRDATMDAIASADAVVVSGGGNLSSTWPDLLYERAAILHLARIFGKPAVVLGQTLGPSLSGAERRLLTETLSSARFVGLRELPSVALALELGVPPERLWYQCDDALFVAGPDVDPEALPLSSPKLDSSLAPAIAVTIDPQIRATKGAVFGALVSQLRELSARTGARLVLIPHVFGNESTAVPSDLTEATVLAEQLGLSHAVVATGLDARQVRQITSAAALVISSRYHPIVFALAAGVPAIGIYGDDYCRIKLQGALAHAQLERWTITYDAVIQGELLPKALDLWNARSEVRRELECRREAWREESRERWHTVLRALDATRSIPPLGPATMFGRPLEDMAAAFASASEARREWRQSERVICDRSATTSGAKPAADARRPENEGLFGILRHRASSLRSRFRRLPLKP